MSDFKLDDLDEVITDSRPIGGIKRSDLSILNGGTRKPRGFPPCRKCKGTGKLNRWRSCFMCKGTGKIGLKR